MIICSLCHILCIFCTIIGSFCHILCIFCDIICVFIFRKFSCSQLLSPVLTKTADGVVIIAGYDQYNTILLKPGEAETYYYGLEESADMFEAAGNQFVTYFDPLEE